MKEVVVLAHNIRSTHNIGSIFRTCEGLGVKKIFCSGYTPFPTFQGDKRLPHIADKLTRQISKTSLGAEKNVPFLAIQDITEIINKLKKDGFDIIALEQTPNSVILPKLKTNPNQKIALLLGEEVHGITQNLLKECDYSIEIPMFGQKESFNVSVATGIALYKIICDS